MNTKASGLYWIAAILALLLTTINGFSILRQSARSTSLARLNALKNSPIVIREIEKQKWLKNVDEEGKSVHNSKGVRAKPGEGYEGFWDQSSVDEWLEYKAKLSNRKGVKAVKAKANVGYETQLGQSSVIKEGGQQGDQIQAQPPAPEAVEDISQVVRTLSEQSSEGLSTIADMKDRIISLRQRAAKLKDNDKSSSDEGDLEEYIRMKNNMGSTPMWR